LDPVSWLTTSIEGLTGSAVIQAFLASCIGFLVTVAGALPSLAWIKAGDVILTYGMGFAAGVMISASFTSLLIPAYEVGGLLPVTLGFPLGALAVYAIDRFLPHEHVVKGYEGSRRLEKKIKAAWLLALAVIIHNIPEGAAIGAAVVESLRKGVVLALAIGIQNFPEGLAVSLPLVSAKKSLKQPLLIAVFSGAVEPAAAVVAATVASASEYALPVILSLASGAMLYVVSHEIIPETHSERREVKATMALIAGLLLMFALDAHYGH